MSLSPAEGFHNILGGIISPYRPYLHVSMVRPLTNSTMNSSLSSSPDNLEGSFSDMPVDVHGCARHDVPHRFIGQVLPVNERPPHGVNELLRKTRGERRKATTKQKRRKAKGDRGDGVRLQRFDTGGGSGGSKIRPPLCLRPFALKLKEVKKRGQSSRISY